LNFLGYLRRWQPHPLRRRSFHASDRSNACSVFLRSMAAVMGPTPPETGVMTEASPSLPGSQHKRRLRRPPHPVRPTADPGRPGQVYILGNVPVWQADTPGACPPSRAFGLTWLLPRGHAPGAFRGPWACSGPGWRCGAGEKARVPDWTCNASAVCSRSCRRAPSASLTEQSDLPPYN